MTDLKISLRAAKAEGDPLALLIFVLLNGPTDIENALKALERLGVKASIAVTPLNDRYTLVNGEHVKHKVDADLELVIDGVTHRAKLTDFNMDYSGLDVRCFNRH